jgi:hypothetical protein
LERESEREGERERGERRDKTYLGGCKRLFRVLPLLERERERREEREMKRERERDGGERREKPPGNMRERERAKIVYLSAYMVVTIKYKEKSNLIFPY